MATRTRSTRKVEVWMYVKDGSRLRRRRRDKGLSQVQLSALAGCTQQYVSAIEGGLDRDVSEKIAERLCKYLDISLEDYFEERVLVRMRGDATVARDGSKRVSA